MEWDVSVSNSFKILVVIGLIATILPKFITAAGVQNPTGIDILKKARLFFERQGFDVAGLTKFSDRDSLLVQKDNCMMYVIPVAHQGWNQATIKQALVPGQSIWFQFEGKLTRDVQDTGYPLLIYYTNKAVNYLGYRAGYPAVLAIVCQGTCDLMSLAWNSLDRVSFQRVTLAD